MIHCRHAEGKTKKDHIKTRRHLERSQHRTHNSLPRKETTEIVRPRVKVEWSGCHKDVKHACAGKEKNGGSKRDG